MNGHISGVGGSNDLFYLNDTTFRSTCLRRLGPVSPSTMTFYFSLFIQRSFLLLFSSHTFLIRFF